MNDRRTVSSTAARSGAPRLARATLSFMSIRHKRAWSRAIALVTASSLVTSATWAATPADFERAERIRSFDDRTLGGIVYAHWLPDGRRFTYYSRALSDGAGTVFLVDPAAGTKAPLFAAAALAAALSKISGSTVDPAQLPSWRLIDNGARLATIVEGRSFVCSLAALACRADPNAASALGPLVPDWATRSPDGKWDAFVWNYNLYIRPAGMPLTQEAGSPMFDDGDGNARFGRAYGYYFFQPSGQRAGCDNPAPRGPVNAEPPAFQPPPPGSIAITTDGERLYSYGPRWKGGAEVATLDSDRYRPTTAEIVWSPDSSRLVIRREDIRGVGVYPLYSSTANQPVDHSYYFAAPGAQHIPQYDLYIADIAKRAALKVDVPSNSMISGADGERWSADSRRLLAAGAARDYQTVTLYDVDPATGGAKPLIRESSKTYVRMSSRGDPNIAVDDKSGDIFWFSEKDGWGHLYRYDRNGQFKNQVDKGNFVFSQIIHVDGDARQIYFTTWGNEPANLYHRHFYRIGFDGSGMKELTPEPGDHDVRWFPKGGYFLDTYQSVDRPPVTVVRRADGAIVQTVSRGTDAPLRAIGWRPAEQFTVKARDGKTDLYGIINKPSNFDPEKRYPVIVSIYPGPQIGSVTDFRFQGADNFGPREDERKPITHGEGMSQSLAELGFIVVRVNSLGTAERDKAFADFTYKNVIDNGLPDQIAALKQLAQRYPWLDLDRVGIVGHSGGGFAAAAAMLTHPEFFKVGVAESGNHDFRTYGWYWGEQYQGPLKTEADAALYAKQANLTYARNLAGKLLLVHGDMDCNNPPAQTLRLADALIAADKPFDLLLVPESGHQLPPYVMRRVWDYFLTNLKGQAPVKD